MATPSSALMDPFEYVVGGMVLKSTPAEFPKYHQLAYFWAYNIEECKAAINSKYFDIFRMTLLH